MTPLLHQGRLTLLTIQDQRIVPSTRLLVYAAHHRDRPLGPVGNWLLHDLRQRMVVGDSGLPPAPEAKLTSPRQRQTS